jgi:hypothetical protein
MNRDLFGISLKVSCPVPAGGLVQRLLSLVGIDDEAKETDAGRRQAGQDAAAQQYGSR